MIRLLDAHGEMMPRSDVVHEGWLYRGKAKVYLTVSKGWLHVYSAVSGTRGNDEA